MLDRIDPSAHPQAQEEAITVSGVTPPEDAWRQTHLGRLLGHAMRRFDERVLYLMAHDVEVPLVLSNLAARNKVSAAHIMSRGICRCVAIASPRWRSARA